MSKKLSEKEIKQRLIRLSNLANLHDKQRSRNEKLTKENKRLKERIAHLEAKDKEKDTLIESLRLQVEELKGMVFRKRKKKQEETDNDTPAKGRKSAKQDRTVDSYRRAAPNDEEITKTAGKLLWGVDAGKRGVRSYEAEFANKLLSAMRFEFGGHIEKSDSE